MKAIITSIGESTTELCQWSLERLGFDVQVIEAQNSLYEKLKLIFLSEDEDFLRVDADVVCNKNVYLLTKMDTLWWYQPLLFDWYKQNTGYGGIQFVRQPAIAPCRKAIYEAAELDRPESYLYRIAALHNPRRTGNFDIICGLNGYKQTDIDRVKAIKKKRAYYNSYDWELAERLNAL